jgi:hypothetical protein
MEFFKILLILSFCFTKISKISNSSSTTVGIQPFKAIENVTLQISQFNSTNIFDFSIPINLSLNIASGSNATVKIDLAGELYNATFNGILWDNLTWMTQIKVKYPGSYNLTTIIYNQISSKNITKSIKVVSRLDNLTFVNSNITNVLNASNYLLVPYLSTKSSGRAFFNFKFTDKSYPGHNSNVTIITDDFSLGPFELKMDFLKNISKTMLFYDYFKPGNYNAEISVENEISSKKFNVTINVTESLDGVYAQFIPPYVVIVNTTNLTQMQVFIAKGHNIEIQWFVNGSSLGKYKRNCKFNN